MRPSLPRFNSTNGVFTNAIIDSNQSLKAWVCTNCANLLFSQFCAGTTLTSVRSPVFGAVALIALCRIPAQIFKVIVPRVAVIMTALQTNWSRANKSSQNQSMWLKDFDFVVLPKPHKRAVFLFVKRICFDLACFYGAHVSMIRNFIGFFKTNCRQPTFHEIPLMWHMGIVL